MGIQALWVVSILTIVLWGLAIGIVALNGVTEVATSGPGFLPFDRWFRKRTPATPGDFVIHGAAQVVQAFGLTLMAVPISLLLLLSTAALTTGWHPPSPPAVPSFVGLAVFVLYILSLTLGLFCVLRAYFIAFKVSYVGIATQVRTSS